MKKLFIISAVSILYFSSGYAQTGNIRQSGISGICQYLEQVKIYSETIASEVVKEEAMIVDMNDTSEGVKTDQRARLQILQLHYDNSFFDTYNELRTKVNAFILVLETDLTSRNKLKLSSSTLYGNLLKEIDSIFSGLKAAKGNFDRRFEKIVTGILPKGESNNGAATPFSLTSLVPDPEKILTDIVGIFQSRRDFKAQQVQSVNATLESLKLSSIDDLGSGQSASPAGSADSQSGKGGTKKPKGKG